MLKRKIFQTRFTLYLLNKAYLKWKNIFFSNLFLHADHPIASSQRFQEQAQIPIFVLASKVDPSNFSQYHFLSHFPQWDSFQQLCTSFVFRGARGSHTPYTMHTHLLAVSSRVHFFNIYCPRERNQTGSKRPADDKFVKQRSRRNGETDRSQLTLWATGVSVTGNAKEILVTRRIASIVPVTALDQSALVFLLAPNIVSSFHWQVFHRHINSATATPSLPSSPFVSRNCFAKFRFIDSCFDSFFFSHFFGEIFKYFFFGYAAFDSTRNENCDIKMQLNLNSFSCK